MKAYNGRFQADAQPFVLLPLGRGLHYNKAFCCNWFHSRDTSLVCLNASLFMFWLEGWIQKSINATTPHPQQHLCMLRRKYSMRYLASRPGRLRQNAEGFKRRKNKERWNVFRSALGWSSQSLLSSSLICHCCVSCDLGENHAGPDAETEVGS